ncbi:tetratricopeptide repeat protein [Actinophytocola oryzae]|nr:tetratricopeptide repeat protein [Actinophytocola oryzae]
MGLRLVEAGDAPVMSEHRRVLELIDAVSLERHGPAGVGVWLGDHRAEVVATIRACDQDGAREQGTRLAAAVWPSAALVRDPRWWEELAGVGEALAVADRDPRRLAELLHSAAATFAAHGDRLRAEERWVRALAVVRRDGDRVRHEAVLGGLGDLYRGWGRLSKALDAYLGLVDLRRDLDDPARLAEAYVAVATTMHDAGRLRSATDYFDRADEVLTEVEAPVTHAGVLVWCGRTRWEQGEHGAARRRWSRALAMLVDVDEDTADRVRALLATGQDERPPYWSNTASSPSGGVG